MRNQTLHATLDRIFSEYAYKLEKIGMLGVFVIVLEPDPDHPVDFEAGTVPCLSRVHVAGKTDLPTGAVQAIAYKIIEDHKIEHPIDPDLEMSVSSYSLNEPKH